MEEEHEGVEGVDAVFVAINEGENLQLPSIPHGKDETIFRYFWLVLGIL